MIDRYSIVKDEHEIEIFKSMQCKNYIIILDELNDFKVRFHVDNYDTIKKILFDIYKKHIGKDNEFNTEYKMSEFGGYHHGNWVIVDRIPHIIGLMNEYKIMSNPSINSIKLNGFGVNELKSFSISTLKKISKEKLKG